jgi:uncharacterized membrane protein YkoI
MSYIAAGGLAILSLTALLGCSKQPPSDLPVTEPAARAKALEKVPGNVVHHEIDDEDDRWVHSFRIEPSAEPKALKEVDVDAHSGEVVAIENE